MSLRLLQIVVPQEDGEAVGEVLAEADVVDFWSRELRDGRDLTEVLLNADRAEGLTDALRERLLPHEGFRLVLLSIEATVPRVVESPEEDEVAPEPADASEGPPGRLGRDELYADVVEGAGLDRVYVVTVILASLLAAVGLVRDDPIILVGAMVVAPLLGPNLALSFATTLGDLPLVRRSLVTTAVGVTLAATFSVLVGMIMAVDPAVPAMADRTRVGVADIAVALAAGSAGALTFTSGLPSALVGVMVAVALLPPLVNAGLLLGSGWTGLALGSLTLVLTNVVCLNLAGVVTFRLQRIQPRSWWAADRARKAIRAAIWLNAVLLSVLLVVILLVWGG